MLHMECLRVFAAAVACRIQPDSSYLLVDNRLDYTPEDAEVQYGTWRELVGTHLDRSRRLGLEESGILCQWDNLWNLGDNQMDRWLVVIGLDSWLLLVG